MANLVESESLIPRGNLKGFTEYFKNDFLAGCLVFLIALPLCLGISLASGFPPLAGVFTAIIGSVIATVFSNSELTIKGPAAGLIVIVVGCVEAFGGDGRFDALSAADVDAYRAALAVGVVAAILQIAFGFFRAGVLGDFFPVSAVHGMLAAIGVIIIAKQIPVALGVQASGEPLELLKEIPHFIAQANPAIAFIGAISLLIMFLWPLLGKTSKIAKRIPSPVVVLLLAVPMGMFFDLTAEHDYVFQGVVYKLDDHFLVDMPDRAFGMFTEITTPNFHALKEPKAWTWVFMFFVIGSLESILSAKAVDLLDPWKRKANMDRDIIAVGIGNFFCSCVGGLPMISEIVRSKANIDNGAKTRFANFWHGMFLLSCVALLPMALHRIPLAALAAMLVYTGYRLAHPSEFLNVWKIGREQLIIFVTTLVAVLATDLLIGIAIGIAVKFIIHLANGVPLYSLFRSGLEVIEENPETVRIKLGKSAVFSNWIALRRQLESRGLLERHNVILDMTETNLVDHSVMDKLHEMEEDFHQHSLVLTILGLESLQPLASHEYAARKRTLSRVRRLTVVIDRMIGEEVAARSMQLGATGYTAMECWGRGKREYPEAEWGNAELVRLEIIAPVNVTHTLLGYLRSEVMPTHRLTVAVEHVMVDRLAAFEFAVDGNVKELKHAVAETVT